MDPLEEAVWTDSATNMSFLPMVFDPASQNWTELLLSSEHDCFRGTPVENTTRQDSPERL
jgi:hypothetical protein